MWLNILRNRFVWCVACLAMFSAALLLFAAESSSRRVVGEPDWADVFMLNGRTYQPSMLVSPGETRLESSDLGPAYATIQFQVAGNASLGYFMKDGDATLLPADTTVYKVKGYAPSFRLTVEREGQLVLYEALISPGAPQGSDLLDLGGNVQTIMVRRVDAGDGVIGRMTDPARVNRFVNMLLQAPVDMAVQTTGERLYSLNFELQDGTLVAYEYNLDANVLDGRISLPPSVRAEIEELVTDGALHAP